MKIALPLYFLFFSITLSLSVLPKQQTRLLPVSSATNSSLLFKHHSSLSILSELSNSAFPNQVQGFYVDSLGGKVPIATAETFTWQATLEKGTVLYHATYTNGLMFAENKALFFSVDPLQSILHPLLVQSKQSKKLPWNRPVKFYLYRYEVKETIEFLIYFVLESYKVWKTKQASYLGVGMDQHEELIRYVCNEKAGLIDASKVNGWRAPFDQDEVLLCWSILKNKQQLVHTHTILLDESELLNKNDVVWGSAGYGKSYEGHAYGLEVFPRSIFTDTQVNKDKEILPFDTLDPAGGAWWLWLSDKHGAWTEADRAIFKEYTKKRRQELRDILGKKFGGDNMRPKGTSVVRQAKPVRK